MAMGANGAAVALSYIAVVFSFAVSWINCAADYNVRMPLSTPRYKIFAATYLGITLPSILVMTLGAALYTGAQTDPTWKQSYSRYGVGGPLAKALEPAGGFGKFCLVLAGLSSIPNNIPNNYSFALHAQNFGVWAIKVPRIAFVTVGFVVATVVGCVASISFESSLLTVLSIVGYWTVVHLVVVAEEHILFRKSRWSMYNWDAWDKPDLLPFGWGAIGAFVFGFLGAALGMKVTWYKAPIAALVGKNGGNIGHELTFAFSAVAFPLFRWTEKRWSEK
ncbi:Purine-cytosine permease FCY2 [Pseudocercospora fuligena]|uniref:Purine-cytosine permease FCY2 n=1 Tax=Pseudocercospora fuligena TaxID=685502 RepID=A0A8H6R8N8_9PEZI|nr:Purine-cytosine permease FCY2 [Pseudocercospora fuligena]